ncbi:MAG: zinc-ribbon domain-containing protein [Methanoregulaceae archaeon]|nr:zinc-ribbon domain-containing protein [Methanoregulaceae archaeon]
MAFCENCGASIKLGDQFCENCGASVGTNTGNTVPPPPVQPVTAPGPTSGQGQKSPALAAIASFLFSGLGQVYNGSLGKGLLIFFGTIIGYMIFVIPGLIVLVYGIYDAYSTAKKMNEGQIHSKKDERRADTVRTVPDNAYYRLHCYRNYCRNYLFHGPCKYGTGAGRDLISLFFQNNRSATGE